MRKYLTAAFAAITIAAMLATPASAANFAKVTMAELQQVFRAGGYAVSTTGSPEVIVVGDSLVWLTDCGTDGRCAEICFARSYSDVRPTLESVNEWNNTKKIPEASINSDGTLHMEMWMSAVGSTDTNILDTFGWFERYAADPFWMPYASAGEA
jgi:hypothetical protein